MSKKKIEPTEAMVEAGASYAWEETNPGILGWNSISEHHKEGYRRDARSVLAAALNHPDAAGLFECDHTDYVHVDEAATRVEAAREQGWDEAAQHIYNKGWEGVTALRKANPHRPVQELPTMSTPTEPNMQIIENATRKDVRPGDHVVFRHTWKRDGLAVAARREGIAHHLDDGNWCTEAGMYITLGVGEDVTITIRRAAQKPPTRLGSIIVVNDGHEHIEATIHGETYRAREAVFGVDVRWHGVWRSTSGTLPYATPDQITPGTWKVDGEDSA